MADSAASYETDDTTQAIRQGEALADFRRRRGCQHPVHVILDSALTGKRRAACKNRLPTGAEPLVADRPGYLMTPHEARQLLLHRIGKATDSAMRQAESPAGYWTVIISDDQVEVMESRLVGLPFPGRRPVEAA